MSNSTLHFCKTPLAGDRGWKENAATKGQVGREKGQKELGELSLEYEEGTAYVFSGTSRKEEKLRDMNRGT